MKNKVYDFSCGNSSFWNAEISDICSELDTEFLTMETALQIGESELLQEKLLHGTPVEYCTLEDIRMALEAIFVTKFKKESPEDFERIPVEELKRELQDEFFTSHL